MATRPLTTKQILQRYKISSYTLRNWRRGWYTDENGKHYFFTNKSFLPHLWNEDKRRFQFDTVEVKVWVKRLREKISTVRAEAARERGRKNRKAGGK